MTRLKNACMPTVALVYSLIFWHPFSAHGVVAESVEAQRTFVSVLALQHRANFF
jgi:hypothetical protein